MTETQSESRIETILHTVTHL